MEPEEHLLSDLGLLRGRGAAKDVEADVEPLVDVPVDDVVLVAELLGGDLFYERPRLGRGSVLVGSCSSLLVY